MLVRLLPCVAAWRWRRHEPICKCGHSTVELVDIRVSAVEAMHSMIRPLSLQREEWATGVDAH